jgi:hypothetical protein
VQENVLWFYEQASPEAVQSGLAWYDIASRWCHIKAQEYEVRPEVVAAIVSALSPRNKWQRNLYDTEQVLLNYAEGYQHPLNIVSGTFRKNVEKAWRVIINDDPSEVLTSPKTKAFVDNIVNPHTSVEVTVDVWARRIAEGDLTLPARSIVGDAYVEYANAYREVAEDVGLRPCQLQAVTWVEARNRVGNKVVAEQLRLL